MAELEDGDYGNPFAPENAAGLSLIVQMRIYDTLMAILNSLDAETADLVYEAHKKGRIISDLPAYLPEETDDENI